MLEAVTKYANENYDGHFTLLKFTSNYRVCFGTLGYKCDYGKYRNQISLMREGKTLDEALYNLMISPIDAHEIEEQAEDII